MGEERRGGGWFCKGGRRVEGAVTPPRLACPDVGLAGTHGASLYAAVWRVGTVPWRAAAQHSHTHTRTRTIFFLDGSEVS